MTYAILGTSGFLSLLLLFSCYLGEGKYKLLFKTLASIGFVSVGIVCYLYSNKNKIYFLVLLIALIFGMFGDVLLELQQTFKNKADMVFLLGVGSFLIGHIFYIVLFSLISPIKIIDIILGLSIGIAYVILMHVMQFHLRQFKIPVIFYSIVICLMFIKSIGVFRVLQNQGGYLVLIGAFLFLISDVILSFMIFSTKNHPSLTAFNLITYYGGQNLLAFSILFL